MRATLPALCLALLLPTLPAGAQECDPSDETQSGMNLCAHAAYRAQDARLNDAYRRVMQRLAVDAGDRKLLQAAQRAWIAFRDAECAFRTEGYAGGSLRPMLVSQCLADLTAARTAQLEAHLSCEEGDLACAPAPAD